MNAALAASENAIVVENLTKTFRARGPKAARLTAVDDVSFAVPLGSTLGIMGESGSGKSTTARIIACLLAADEGTVEVLGTRVERHSRAVLRHVRSNVQMVFQDPYSALDPRMTILESVTMPLRARRVPAATRNSRGLEVLDRVGLRNQVARSRPRQLSGGQLQRAAIARALVVEPQILVLDEPVAALDRSVQALVINLLGDLQEELSLTYVFISHDLDVIDHVSDSIVVMRNGSIVDRGDRLWIFEESNHPYTLELRSALDLTEA